MVRINFALQLHNYSRILASPIFVRRKYLGWRYLYYSNAVATTQFLLLRRSGNVELNPGPQKTGLSASKSICSFCEKVLKRNQNGVECLACARGFHVKCSGMTRKQLASYRKNAMPWTCFPCTMPQISDSFFVESTHSPLKCSAELSTENHQDQTDSIQWYKDNICSYYKSNLKISY